MRLIKLQFTNLKSLAGTWTIDFEHPDFKSSGLFLITGPTGAGKTTILDAVCLALYGQTPQFENISQNNNELMTKNTGHCSVEITFENSKGRFTAIWAQHRAKRNPLGDLQPISHKLIDAAGNIISELSSNTKIRIKEITGLDYSQFVRAVMLAQNSFDKFLKADDRDKSSILEKLTDTSIYSSLSRLSHKKKIQAENDLNSLLNQASRFTPLSDEDIATKKSRIETLNQASQSMEKELAIFNLRLNAVNRFLALKAEMELLEQEQMALNKEKESLAPSLERLKVAKKAAGIESIYNSVAKLRGDAQSAKHELHSAEASLKNTDKAFEEARENYEQTESQGKAHEAYISEIQPALEKAARLDIQIYEKQKLATEAANENKKNDLRLMELTRELSRQQEDLNKQESACREIDNWLKAHQNDEWLEANFSSCELKIRQCEEYETELKSLQSQNEKEQESMKKCLMNQANTQELINQEDQKISDCKALLEDLQTRQISMLGGLTLEELRSAWHDKSKKAERYKSLEEHRKELKSGEPCPLCGSLEHPWAYDGEKELSSLEIQINDLSKQIKDIEELQPSINKVEKDRDKAILEHAKLLETLSKHASLYESHEKNSHITLERINDLQNRLSLLASELNETLQSLNITGNLSYNAILRVLQDRLKDLQNHKQEKEKLLNSILAIQPRLIKTRTDKTALEEIIKNHLAISQKLNEELALLKRERMEALPDKSVAEVKQDLEDKTKKLKKMLDKALNKYTEVKGRLDEQKGAKTRQEQIILKLKQELGDAEAAFKNVLTKQDLTEAIYLEIRLSNEKIEELTDISTALDKKEAALNARKETNKKALAEEVPDDAKTLDKNEIENNMQLLQKQNKELLEERAVLANELNQNEENIQKTAQFNNLITAAKNELNRWNALYARIGSEDGKKFRAYAQAITMDRLLAHANRQLQVINPRYALKRKTKNTDSNREQNLDIEIMDNYQAGDIRGVDTLSGGETFMASLALALGLSEMAGRNTSLGTLFLDEGFGTLDYNSLETAFAAISKLRKDNQLIGIISHVEALKEWIPNQIHVSRNPFNITRSTISGPGCDG